MSAGFKSKSTGTARASTSLPAGGAFDDVASAPTIPLPSGDTVALLVEYTRGAVGGAVQLRVWDSVDEVTWYLRCVLDAGSYASGVVDADPMTLKMPVSSGAVAERYSVMLDTTTARNIRVTAAEYGVTATPGTCAVSVMAANGG